MCTKTKLVKKECQFLFSTLYCKVLSVHIADHKSKESLSEISTLIKIAFSVCPSGSVNIARSQEACNNDPTMDSLSGTASDGYSGIHLPVKPLDAICRVWKKLEEREGETGACLTGSMAQAQGEE